MADWGFQANSGVEQPEYLTNEQLVEKLQLYCIEVLPGTKRDDLIDLFRSNLTPRPQRQKRLEGKQVPSGFRSKKARQKRYFYMIVFD